MAEDQERIERLKTLEKLMEGLDEYEPTIPDAATEHFLARTGCAVTDERMVKLISLAAQKFITDVCKDALQYSEIRQQAPASSAGSVYKDRAARGQKKRVTLTSDDVQRALPKYGVAVNKPVYYADQAGSTTARKY